MTETKARTVASAFISTVTLPMPTAEQRAESRGKGGNRGVYPFEALEVGKSIAVIGRNAKQLSTTISTANAKGYPVTDAAGKPVLTAKLGEDNKPVKGEDGKPVMIAKTRKFFAINCNPETDPEKATARIWREQ